MRKIRTAFEPADKEVVAHGHNPCGSNGVVGTNVGDDVDL